MNLRYLVLKINYNKLVYSFFSVYSLIGHDDFKEYD